MGVLFAFVYSVMVLPALMAMLPVRVKVKAEEAKPEMMDRLAAWVIQNRKPLLIGGMAVMAIMTFFITRNELDDKFVEYFDRSTEFRQSADFTMENLTGVYTVEYSIGADGPSGISEPTYQQKLDEFTIWWLAQPHVLHVNTFSDVMKRVNRSMNGDDPASYVVPDNRQLAAQLLLLYGNSLPRGFGLDNQINVDESSTRFIVTLGNLSARELRGIAQEGERWLESNAPEYMWSIGVSPSIMFSYISERNIKSMLTGTTVALVLISGILIVALRSFRLGIISLLPNLAPAAISFGIWGLLVGRIGLSLSVVTAMSLGIVVDDTVHFLSKYARARREKGLDAQAAVRYAFSSVGMALLITSIILVIGFSILSLSSFELNKGLGRLTAIVIVVALTADFFILPPLLMALGNTRIGLKKEKGPT
jgi:predicted RND superfamily exporter protein